MALFQPVIRKARFKVSGYSGEDMLSIGQLLAEDVKKRILRAENIYDQPAIPLRPQYAKYKAANAPPAIRNWFFTGRTLRSLKCVSASVNLAVIRFTDAVTNKRAFINNRKERQFGSSPRNGQYIKGAMQSFKSPVAVVKG